MNEILCWERIDDWCHRHEGLVPRFVAKAICDHLETLLGVPKEQLR